MAPFDERSGTIAASSFITGMVGHSWGWIRHCNSAALQSIRSAVLSSALKCWTSWFSIELETQNWKCLWALLLALCDNANDERSIRQRPHQSLSLYPVTKPVRSAAQIFMIPGYLVRKNLQRAQSVISKKGLKRKIISVFQPILKCVIINHDRGQYIIILIKVWNFIIRDRRG